MANFSKDSLINIQKEKDKKYLEGLKKEYQFEFGKINSITIELNKHISILSENLATFAKIQAIINQNSEKIDKICKQLFNQGLQM